MNNAVNIKFKKNCKLYTFDANGLELKKGDYVIVDTARGIEFATVYSNVDVKNVKVKEPLKKVIRRATREDIKHNEENTQKEKEAYKVVKQKIKDYQLDMKLVGCEYMFDNSKLLFYFTSEQRVDFRDLVKDIASIYITRIELRQIGARDEVKMLGDCGVCGNHLCCTSFLNDVEPVSIKMAKEQGLALNPQKISGLCGRLMCCLKYEQCVYEEKLQKVPKIGARVKTQDGEGIVSQVDILGEMVKVKFEKSKEEISYNTYPAKDIKVIPK